MTWHVARSISQSTWGFAPNGTISIPLHVMDRFCLFLGRYIHIECFECLRVWICVTHIQQEALHPIRECTYICKQRPDLDNIQILLFGYYLLLPASANDSPLHQATPCYSQLLKATPCYTLLPRAAHHDCFATHHHSPLLPATARYCPVRLSTSSYTRCSNVLPAAPSNTRYPSLTSAATAATPVTLRHSATLCITQQR